MRDQVDAIGMAAGKAGSIGAGAGTFIFGMAMNEFAAAVGALCAVLGVLIQWRYTVRKRIREDEQAARDAAQADRDAAQAERDAEFHVARMASLRDGRHGDQQQH